MTASTKKSPAAGWPERTTSAAGFAGVLRTWLAHTDHNQKSLALAIGVHPSTVSGWVQGHKRPDLLSLLRTLATLRGWLGPRWPAHEALDAVACLGWDWWAIQAAAGRLLKKGMPRRSWPGGIRPGRPCAASSGRPGPCSTCRAAVRPAWLPR